MDPDKLRKLYCWVDTIPLSRPKRNIAKDFCDGVMVAEIVAHLCPSFTFDLQDLGTATTPERRLRNWDILNATILKRLGIQLTKAECEAICNCERGAIESLLFVLQPRLEQVQKQPLHTSGTAPSGGETGSDEAAEEKIARLVAALAQKDAENSQLQNVISLLNLKVDSLERHLRLKQATIRLLEERAGIAELDSLVEEPVREPQPNVGHHVGRANPQEEKSASSDARGSSLFPEEYDSIDSNIQFMQGRMAGYV